MGSSATGLVWPALFLTAFLYVASFFYFGTNLDAGGLEGFDAVFTVVGAIIDFITFDVPGIPGWLSVAMFLIVAVPWAIILSDVTGVAGQVVTFLGLVVGFFASLF